MTKIMFKIFLSDYYVVYLPSAFNCKAIWEVIFRFFGQKLFLSVIQITPHLAIFMIMQPMTQR